MKILKRLIKVTFLCTLSINLIQTSVNANELDDLRQIIESRNYTIRYEIIDSRRQEATAAMKKNISAMTVYRDITDMIDKNTSYPQYVAICDGSNAYMEITETLIGQVSTRCSLLLNNSVYRFTRMIFGKKVIYSTFGGNKLIPEKARSSDDNFRFGSQDFKTALITLFPDIGKNTIEERYNKVNEGINEEGLKYFDYEDTKSNNHAGVLNAIRFYFKDNILIRIAFAYYSEIDGKPPTIERRIIEIKEIKPMADKSYFQIPKELR